MDKGLRVFVVSLLFILTPTQALGRLPQGEIIFSLAQGSSNLKILNIRTGHIDGFSFKHFDSEPAWSPDGRFIAWTCNGSHFAGDRPTDICALRIHDGKRWKVTQSQESEGSPSWSPDGRRIVFDRIVPDGTDLDGTDLELFIANYRGGDEVSIASSSLAEGNPDWSPTEDVISFERVNMMGDRDLWTVSLATETEVNLTGGPENDLGPTWSPDGERIAFYRSDQTTEGYHIYLMDSDGANPSRVGSGKTSSGTQPDWSPDGRWLAITANVDDTQTGLFVVRTDGSQRRRVFYNPHRSVFGPAWRPVV